MERHPAPAPWRSAGSTRPPREHGRRLLGLAAGQQDFATDRRRGHRVAVGRMQRRQQQLRSSSQRATPPGAVAGVQRGARGQQTRLHRDAAVLASLRGLRSLGITDRQRLERHPAFRPARVRAARRCSSLRRARGFGGRAAGSAAGDDPSSRAMRAASRAPRAATCVTEGASYSSSLARAGELPQVDQRHGRVVAAHGDPQRLPVAPEAGRARARRPAARCHSGRAPRRTGRRGPRSRRRSAPRSRPVRPADARARSACSWAWSTWPRLPCTVARLVVSIASSARSPCSRAHSIARASASAVRPQPARRVQHVGQVGPVVAALLDRALGRPPGLRTASARPRLRRSCHRCASPTASRRAASKRGHGDPSALRQRQRLARARHAGDVIRRHQRRRRARRQCRRPSAHRCAPRRACLRSPAARARRRAPGSGFRRWRSALRTPPPRRRRDRSRRMRTRGGSTSSTRREARRASFAARRWKSAACCHAPASA